MNRKQFIHRTFAAITGFTLVPNVKVSSHGLKQSLINLPTVISTWPHGMPSNVAAWEVLIEGGRALDAVEQGVRIAELDPEITSVGYGGFPDRDGIITLDASIMDETGNCGSVTFLQHIKTPVSVARLVMEKTPHVMLSGEGALQFALANSFKKEELHTDRSREGWEKWKKSKINTPVDMHNHDTISMLAIDKKGNISGACSTSGLAFKHHGRVGDSPVIGAGLYVDNEVGGAGGTGVGEVIMKTLGSYSIVENMRQGYSPQKACEEAVHRALKKVPDARKQPIYFIALNKQGEYGAYGTNAELRYALFTKKNGNRLLQADSAF